MTNAETIARWCGWRERKDHMPCEPTWVSPLVDLVEDGYQSEVSMLPEYEDMNSLFADIGPIERAKELGWYLILNTRINFAEFQRIVDVRPEPNLFSACQKDPAEAINAATLKLIAHLKEEG